jgi:hypothetical protein
MRKVLKHGPSLFRGASEYSFLVWRCDLARILQRDETDPKIYAKNTSSCRQSVDAKKLTGIFDSSSMLQHWPTAEHPVKTVKVETDLGRPSALSDRGNQVRFVVEHGCL